MFLFYKNFVLLMRCVKEYFLSLQSYFKNSHVILSPFHTISHPNTEEPHILFCLFFFPVRGFCYVSAIKVDKYVIYSLCVLVHKHNLAISFIALLKVSIIMYSSTQNYSSISTNSVINVLDTHLLFIVLSLKQLFKRGS